MSLSTAGVDDATCAYESSDPGAASSSGSATMSCDRARQSLPPPPQLVSFGFADQPDALTPISEPRNQYVNLSSQALLPVDSVALTSANQLGRSPPIAVRVSPPGSVRITLRLVRESHPRGYAAGTDTLSARERGLDTLADPPADSVHYTNADGEKLLQPGLRIPVLAGQRWFVEAKVEDGAFQRSPHPIQTMRRIYIRPVVAYSSGWSAARAAIHDVGTYLRGLGVEVSTTSRFNAHATGVALTANLPQHPATLGERALSAPSDIRARSPHCVAIVVGQFVTETVEEVTFVREVTRLPTGGYSPIVNIPLAHDSRNFVCVPLTDGTAGGCYVHADARAGSRGMLERAGAFFSATRLGPECIGGRDQFSQSVNVDISSALAEHGDAESIEVRVTLRVLAGWANGSSYHDHPVIYLNMRSPLTNAVVASADAESLLLHELGHKLHLTSAGDEGMPDRQPHHYPTTTVTDAVNHHGPHCSVGVAAGASSRGAGDGAAMLTDAAYAAATCNMFGRGNAITTYCPECQATLRKVDLSSGF